MQQRSQIGAHQGDHGDPWGMQRHLPMASYRTVERETQLGGKVVLSGLSRLTSSRERAHSPQSSTRFTGTLTLDVLGMLYASSHERAPPHDALPRLSCAVHRSPQRRQSHPHPPTTGPRPDNTIQRQAGAIPPRGAFAAVSHAIEYSRQRLQPCTSLHQPAPARTSLRPARFPSRIPNQPLARRLQSVPRYGQRRFHHPGGRHQE